MKKIWLGIVALLILWVCIAASEVAAQTTPFYNAKITVLSPPLTGNKITINGRERIFTNGAPNPASVFIRTTNDSMTIPLTNLYSHLALYPQTQPSVLASWDSDTELDIKGFSLTVSVTGPWAAVTYTTNTGPKLETLTLPLSNYALATNQQRMAAWLVDALGYATNKFPTNLVALGEYWNKRDALSNISVTNATNASLTVNGDLRLGTNMANDAIVYKAGGSAKATNRLAYNEAASALSVLEAATNANLFVQGKVDTYDLTASRTLRLQQGTGQEGWVLTLIDVDSGQAVWGPSLSTNSLIQGLLNIPYADWTNRLVAGTGIALTTNINGTVTVTSLGGGGTNGTGTNFLVHTNGTLAANRAILNFLGGVTVADSGSSANVTILGADARATNGIRLITNGTITYIEATNKFGTLVTNEPSNVTDLTALTNAQGVVTFKFRTATNSTGLILTNILSSTNWMGVITNAQGIVSLIANHTNYIPDYAFSNLYQIGSARLTNLAANPIPYTNVIVGGTNISLSTNGGVVTISIAPGADSGAFGYLTQGTNVLNAPSGAFATVFPFDAASKYGRNITVNEANGSFTIPYTGKYRAEFVAKLHAVNSASGNNSLWIALSGTEYSVQNVYSTNVGQLVHLTAVFDAIASQSATVLAGTASGGSMAFTNAVFVLDRLDVAGSGGGSGGGTNGSNFVVASAGTIHVTNNFFAKPGTASATNQFWRVTDTATGAGAWSTVPASGGGGGASLGTLTNQLTLFVSTNGDNATATIGSPNAAWRSINLAVSNAPANSVVKVLPGVYQVSASGPQGESAAINFFAKTNVTLDMVGATIHCTNVGSVINVSNCLNPTFIGGTIVGTRVTTNANPGNFPFCAAIGVYDLNEGLTVIGVTFSNHPVHCIAVRKADSPNITDSRWRIHQCYFTVQGIQFTSGLRDGTCIVPFGDCNISDCWFENINRGYEPYGNDGPTYITHGEGTVIRNSHFINFTEFAINNAGFTNIARLRVEGCHFTVKTNYTGFSNFSIQADWHAIGWNGCNSILIANCTISGKIRTGIYLTAVGPWQSDVQIVNSTIHDLDYVGGSSYGISMLGQPNARNVVIRGNTLYNISGRGMVLCISGGVVQGNTIYNVATEELSHAVQFYADLPGFADPSTNVFFLQNTIYNVPGSSAIANGVTVGLDCDNIVFDGNHILNIATPINPSSWSNVRILGAPRNGRLGIGTNDPQSTLHVHGSVTVLSNITAGGSATITSTLTASNLVVNGPGESGVELADADSSHTFTIRAASIIQSNSVILTPTNGVPGNPFLFPVSNGTNQMQPIPGEARLTQSLSGTGGALTNFTGHVTDGVVFLSGATNVNFVAIMGGIAGVAFNPVYVITNRTGTPRDLSLGATTNNWLASATHGLATPALPISITNALLLETTVMGTNVFWRASYIPNPAP